MRFRKLRIAFSVTCLVACVLLIALWVRSYWWFDHIFFPGPHHIASLDGWLTLDENFIVNIPAVTSQHNSGLVKLRSISGNVVPAGVGSYFPHWLLVVIIALLAGVPWLRWRFSLRTLLIATTLVAVVLGLIVWLR